MNYDSILQVVLTIAHEAGAIVRDSFPRTVLDHIGFKGAVNPVTETDTAVEALIIARLRAAFPGHCILAEEGGGDEGLLDMLQGPGDISGDGDASDGQAIWLIDPLDGTNNFAHGFPCVGLSLALLAAGQPVVGVIYDPLRGETFAATAGGGATLDGQPIYVSVTDHLGNAFLATGFPYDRRTRQQRRAARPLPAPQPGCAPRRVRRPRPGLRRLRATRRLLGDSP